MQPRLMTAMAIFGLIVGVLSTRALADDTDEAVKKDLKALKGDWKVVSRTFDGDVTPAEDVKDRVITFDEEKYILREGSEILVEATYKIDPSKSPKWYDHTTTVGDKTFKGKTLLGIYKLDGDTVTFCTADLDAKRPTDFTSKKGSGQTLLVYKKVK
jgi:uncharacterized protein (TIGR03067 family)